MVDTKVLKKTMFGLAIMLVMMALVLLLGHQPAEAGGSGDYPPPVTGDWVITSDTQVWDETVQLTGVLIVRSGATLDIDNVVENGSSYIRIWGLKNGKMTVLFDKKFEYYFYAEPKDTLIKSIWIH